MSITMGQLATKFHTASKKVKPSSEKQLKALSQVGVGLVKREIQAVHAVATSAMLNSTEAALAGPNTYLIGPTVEYATYVALGTSRMAARPFHIAATSALNKQASLFGFDEQDLGI